MNERRKEKEKREREKKKREKIENWKFNYGFEESPITLVQ